MTRQFVALLVGCALAGCGSGGGPGIPPPGPTRVPLPTLAPGEPTPLPPHFPPSATATSTPTPVVMSFTFRNQCAARQEIRLRLFDETLNLIYLDHMHDYIIASTPADISITCSAGDKICYGGQVATATPTRSVIPKQSTTPQPTPTPVTTFGVGLNNDQVCDSCCFTCAGGTISPIDLRCTSP